MSGGGVAAIVIVTLLLIGGSVAGYFVYKKKDLIRWKQFSYTRQGRRSVLSRDFTTLTIFTRYFTILKFYQSVLYSPLTHFK